jgi:hypothetical protein
LTNSAKKLSISSIILIVKKENKKAKKKPHKCGFF